MNLWLRISVFVTALAVIKPGLAAEPETITQLDEALKAVVTFEYGQDSGPLVRTEQIVVEAAKTPKLREAVEQRLAGALDSASTTTAKSFLCRQLRTIGTARSVPHLEKLLTDPQLSHMARYALGRIEGAAAAAALHRALSKASGKVQVGILNTLADRRYRPAQRDIANLLRSSDSAVAEASAGALGRIGGTQAVKALEAARAGASESLRRRIDNALLICAEQFLADGRTNEAKRIYAKFYSAEQPMHLRLAGLRGFVVAQGPEAVSAIIQAAKDPDPKLRRGAIGLMPMAKGEDATKAFAALLPSLPPETQALMLLSLGARGDAAAAQAIAAATKSAHQPVRIAAIEALGNVGDASVVPVLVQAATAADGTEKQVARASLVHLHADGVDATLMRHVSSGDAKVRVEAIQALTARKVTQAKAEFLRAVRDDNEMVRRDAILALGKLGNESELEKLLALAVKPKDAKDHSAIEQAIAAIFNRLEDKARQAEPVLAALAAAPTDAKPTLLRLLSRPATPKALQAVRSALKDPDAEVKDAAVRTLAEWPNAAPAEDLLTLARTSSDQTHKVLALRGYVRMAGLSSDPTAMYVRAMELAERPDDKKLVLAGLASASSGEALDLVEGYLRDEQLQAEAALAAVQIADRLRQNNATRAKAALENVIKIVDDRRIRQKAQDIINETEQYEGYILAWVAAGPYTEKGKQSRVIFDTVFSPEQPDSRNVEWKRLTQGIGSWDINLEATFGSKDHCAAYMRTRIFSATEQDVRLEMGSDDAIKVWLNGKLVHANYQNRGVSPRQDLVEVKLQKGHNDLLLKVVDHEGGWGFCCRVRKGDGTAFEGLRFEAK